MPSTKKSKELFKKAKNYMPGGVNSPVRAFASVGLSPPVIEQAKGARLLDVDGNEYVDYVCSWGPLILGHAHEQVLDALNRAAGRGTSYGAPCEQEIELAELICTAIASVDKVRLVNSGTEATMSAVRLARAYTGRERIVKFEGCYHGHADAFLIKAGSGMLTGGIPTSPGVPGSTAAQTLTARYNDLASVKKLFNSIGHEIAAVIVEPVAGNMGVVPPAGGFLEGLRQITRAHKSLLIFDEVITGFRLGYGGYQDSVSITPDLTTLGKIIGGGLPVGAYGGKEEIMDMVAPQGPVYQAGTLSGNPLAMAAGVATLRILRDTDCYRQLEKKSFFLVEQIENIIKRKGLGHSVNRVGSMFSIFFTGTGKRVCGYDDVKKCSTDIFSRFYARLLEEGIYFPPSQFETCFLSQAHDLEDMEKTTKAVGKACDGIM